MSLGLSVLRSIGVAVAMAKYRKTYRKAKVMRCPFDGDLCICLVPRNYQGCPLGEDCPRFGSGA